MAQGKAHPPEVKAAVLAALMAGQGVHEIAKEHGIPARTIRLWAGSDDYTAIREKRGERLETATFDYLDGLLKCLKKQTEVFSEPVYLRKQPASEAAVLHGVLADKAFRLLSALPTGNGATEPVEPKPATEGAAQ